jgi:hypothetical protein
MHATGQAAIPQVDQAAAVTENTPAVEAEVKHASVTPEPTTVSPVGYAGLAGLVGLAAGMVLAPWLERFYLRVTKRHPHNDEE